LNPDAQAGIIVHEYGRVYLWDELPDDGNTAKMGDIGNWDQVVNDTLAKDYQKIIAR
jgi:hypothetical protein